MASADEVLAGLDPEQRQVASQPLGPMCVLAGAGTGKTRAITHRIAYGVLSGAYQPGRVLAVTFTARAAGEMRTRLRELGLPGVQARTFHSAALRQLHFFWPQTIGGPAPEVLKHKAPVVAEAGSRLRLRLDRVVIRDLAAEIEWAKVAMVTPAGYAVAARAAGRTPPELDLTAMARLFETYEEVKTARGVIDFEDVLLLMTGILAEHEDVSRAVRAQYRHFVVDEYQDVNTVQQALLDQWVGDRADLCVVGDPAQTIYSFTGASPRHLTDFSQRAGVAVTRLVRNYRSTPQVVQLANLVLQAGARESEGVQLQAQSDAGPVPQLVQLPDDQAEADEVARRIKALIADGVAPSQIAVLYRINAQSEVLEQALSAVDVPYLVRGGERFFERAEVRSAVVLLRGAVRSDDGADPLGKVVRDVITAAGWSPRRPGGGAVLERWQSLDALATLADDFADMTGLRMREFVAELDRRASEQHAPTVEGITLASLHAAKGLEWDAVFLIGCSEGLLPFSMAEGPAQVAEERRLLYVGLTRARRHLTLTWAASRNPGGRASRKPSRFLSSATAVLGEGARGPARTAGPARSSRVRTAKVSNCRVCGKVLHAAAERKIGRCGECPPGYDEAQFEALRAWRLAVATATKVPAFVVFTDATLVAIAEQRPTDVAGLSVISGVGARKLATYGESVLGVLAGDDPQSAAEKCCAAMKSESK
ncbi:ATP-dependent DNA helicase UvrD2 [Allobranchiibius huperziae]|uniref:DNA 3'-5' helicase n=1 Tax=Allobranchiibius huperziae TaxID=1874116 RepID=A0A853DG54_9MICO|nr:ATP-dependent DNA helicase UvrD2 [Allobranchiibius huperziae]NYJ73851.1 DNA helicase-2/ATP-dependent DNA helicase PcrA [Allobranchiibius huperziae]